MYRNINENYGDQISFNNLDEMAAAIEACGYELPEDGLREGRDYELVMWMNPATGSVAPASEWQAEYAEAAAAGFPDESLWHDGDLDGLVEVVPNEAGRPGYDADYGDWRPVNA